MGRDMTSEMSQEEKKASPASFSKPVKTHDL